MSCHWVPSACEIQREADLIFYILFRLSYNYKFKDYNFYHEFVLNIKRLVQVMYRKKYFIFMKKFFLEMDSGSMLWYTSRITTGLRIRIYAFLQGIQAPAFILMEMEAGL